MGMCVLFSLVFLLLGLLVAASWGSGLRQRVDGWDI